MFIGLTLSDFLKEWVSDNDDEKYRRIISTEKVLKSELDLIACPYYGSIKLFPEQQWSANAIFDRLGFGKACCSAVLHDNRTGGGKTYVAAAVVDKLFKSGILNQPQYLFTQHVVLIFTPKPVCIQYERVFRAAGLGDYLDDGRIVIDNYAALYSSRSASLLATRYDPVQDQEITEWHGTSRPALIICDEAHVLANQSTKQTKAVRALLRDSPTTALLAFTATPFIKVNDSYVIATAIRRPFWNGEIVGDHNFKLFAASISQDPSRPNMEGIKRLRAALGPYIVSAPYVKWPSRQVNSVVCCDFRNDAEYDIYRSAAARLREKTIALGKNPDHRFRLLVELNAFCNAAEPLRAHYFEDRVRCNYRTGAKRTIIATRNKETIVKTLYSLIQSGMRRDQFSIIWGGVDAFNPDELLPLEDARKMLLSGDDISDRDLKRCLKTLRYYEDQIRHGETAEQQAERHTLLRSWGLFGAQSAEARQEEVDRFQCGKTVACFMTAAAGGTGLSLDTNSPRLLPTELYGSPSFNARQVAQMLGRTVRRATIQKEVFQFMCFLRGTEEEHVIMPYMDEKLACMAGFNKSNIDLAKVWMDAISGERVAVPERVRTLAQAVEDAQSDESQVFDNPEEDETEEELV